MSRSFRAFATVLVAAAVVAGSGRWLRAEEKPGFFARNVFSRYAHHMHDTPPPGHPRSLPYTHERAGYPLCLSSFSQPTETPYYQSYYVGGSAPLGHGDARCPHEGTFGWDFVGIHLPRRVALGWNHGRRYQSGSGSYRTDGPPVPDPIAETMTKIRKHGFKEPGAE
jgi:hypothetical protein